MIKDEITHLNLTGKNEEDLNIISAYLQDSIVLTKDITFLRLLSLNSKVDILDRMSLRRLFALS